MRQFPVYKKNHIIYQEITEIIKNII
jgi:hypothetical protein